MPIPNRPKADGKQAGSPLLWRLNGKKKYTQRQKRKALYKNIVKCSWEQIDKLSTLDRYTNSFNMLINDALDYGLPMLIKEAFGEIDYEEETKLYNSVHSREEEFYGQVVRLFAEAIMNMNINKAILSSLFKAKRLELIKQPVSAEAFSTGCFQDTPEFANDYELRELRRIRNM